MHQAGQTVLWEDSHTIDSSLRLEPAPGHTPGSSVLKLHSGSDRVVFAGDTVHVPMQFLEPQYSSCLCEDPAIATATRLDMFTFDITTHLRYDIVKSRGPIKATLRPLDERQLGPAVSWLLAGIPRMQPKLPRELPDHSPQAGLTSPGRNHVLLLPRQLPVVPECAVLGT